MDRSVPSPAPPPAQLFQMISGFWVSQCINVAAKLDVADLLASGPMDVEAIARATGSQPDNLRRVLRALASIGIFVEDEQGCYGLSPLADYLRSDHPQSQRALALITADFWNWSTWAELLTCVKTGENPFERVYGTDLFEFLRANPEIEPLYSDSMRAISVAQILAVVESYPFDGVGTLVDVGGAHGHLLTAVLEKHPSIRGILFDQPQVIAAAEAGTTLSAPALSGRIETVSGSFFETVPAGADTYMMKLVLHDWDDAKCGEILATCRKAMPAGGRLLVIENLLKGRNEPDHAKFLDLLMMVSLHGKERTEDEFARLFASAGLRLARVVPTTSSVSVLEVVAEP